MTIPLRPVQRLPLACVAAWLALAPLTAAPAAAPACPEGSTPAPFVPLGTVGLPAELPPGASIAVARITLAAGEELQPETSGYTVFHVVAGALTFSMPPRGGFHLQHPAHGVREDGVSSAGGVEVVDAEGWMRVEAGSSLVADEAPISRIANATPAPLEILLITLRVPEIDPATGQPIPELVTERDARQQHRDERQERRAATPVP